MRTNIAIWEDDRRVVTITATEANVLIGIRRSGIVREMRILIEADEEAEDGGAMTHGEKMVRVYSFPTCLAGVVSIDVTPKKDEEAGEDIVLKADELIDINNFTFDDYLNLPETLALVWEDCVTAINQHWIPMRIESKNSQSEEKKSSPSPEESLDTSAPEKSSENEDLSL